MVKILAEILHLINLFKKEYANNMLNLTKDKNFQRKRKGKKLITTK